MGESGPMTMALPWGRRLADAGRRAVRVWRRDGPARVASIAVRLATSPVLAYGRLVFFFQDLDGEASWPSAPVPEGFEIRRALEPEAARLISAGRADPELAGLRFRRGDDCVVIVDAEGRVVHNRWITVKPTPITELGMEIRPRPGEAYVYDGYTLPRVRGLGLDAASRRFIFDALQAARFRRVCAYVRADNGPGLRAAARCQRRVGELWYLRVRGLRAWVIARRDADERGRDAWPELG